MKPAPALKARWDGMAARERTLVRCALVLVGAALLWWLCLAPALQIVRTAGAEHLALQARLEQMKALQAQALSLRAQPRIGYDDALRALRASVQVFGEHAQIGVAGERATVTFRGIPADALAQWLVQARLNARALPTDARLTRARGAPGFANWDGTVVLALPSR
ncbi:MAG TPA: type II secretion system protein GspM [Rhodoferax sp.]|nr:type II secretion system protein GspM [Rhodoferax sp.]